MEEYRMSHLDLLESESIHIIMKTRALLQALFDLRCQVTVLDGGRHRAEDHRHPRGTNGVSSLTTETGNPA